MSVERLEIIKQQIIALSRQEQVELSQFLAKQMRQDNLNSEAPTPSEAEDVAELRRERNMEWMKANGEEFGGQYIALDGGQLVCAGRTFRETWEASRAAGKPDAFVTYLPKPDEVIEMGGWL